ncbi:opioid growth factor receptor-like isoform X1 [Hoplias malabaricus]|uniref:opioid growth factor receptor-like isoform X1 n=1 Tax=Hoplias malabaricus TaxID=27720 RepID=UPI0034621003
MDRYKTKHLMGNNLFRDKLEDFDTEYDSTWEDDEDDEETEDNNQRWSHYAHRNTYAAMDMQNFRHMCLSVQNEPEEEDDGYEDIPNLLFYLNKKGSEPDNVYIEEFHKKWFGDYKRLERMYIYIQWLFPIQEKGINYDSYVLSSKEIMSFRKSEIMKKNLIKSYELMLDFYGIKLINENTGEVCRAENWKERFENLNRNCQNCFGITRILKCLGILGFQHYQAPLVHFFLQMTLGQGELPRVKQSVLDYFMFAVLDKSERKKLIQFAFDKFEPRNEFVWCPKRIQRRFLRENKNKKAEMLPMRPM